MYIGIEQLYQRRNSAIVAHLSTHFIVFGCQLSQVFSSHVTQRQRCCFSQTLLVKSIKTKIWIPCWILSILAALSDASSVIMYGTVEMDFIQRSYGPAAMSETRLHEFYHKLWKRTRKLYTWNCFCSLKLLLRIAAREHSLRWAKKKKYQCESYYFARSRAISFLQSNSRCNRLEWYNRSRLEQVREQTLQCNAQLRAGSPCQSFSDRFSSLRLGPVSGGSMDQYPLSDGQYNQHRWHWPPRG